MTVQDELSNDFEKLIEHLKVSRGFDFAAYKRPTLQRRVQKRMQMIGVESYADYLDYLEVHQEEFRTLFDTILINVTSYFRDPDAWEHVIGQVVPAILERKGEHEPIRVWVAGCASGEEAYSVAMVLAEAIGSGEFGKRIKIYATDMDDDALNTSRNAIYTERQVHNIRPELLARYFEKVNGRYVFDRELRRSVIFGKHDLVQDAPISRVDLLTCRNTLMYFNAEAQERILARFHFALSEEGFLFLGKAETLLSHANLFVPTDIANRVFKKVPTSRGRGRAAPLVNLTNETPRLDAFDHSRLRDAAQESCSLAQLILDSDRRFAFANAKARSLFAFSNRDIGVPFQDLEISFRPAELRSGVEQASEQRRSVIHRDVQWTPSNGETCVLDIQITPLTNEKAERLGIAITFEDVTHYRRLQQELVNFNQELETAYEEVQSTNEELQTTNEELQSTIEELETTNEELQSTNEELETINEEFQSANEELEAINGELRMRSDELNGANAFLESVMAGLGDSVIVIDRDFQVLAWNHHSTDLWGLRPEEAVGKHLINLDIGLPVDQLKQPLRTCLLRKESAKFEVDAINRRGKPICCEITLTPLLGHKGEQLGVILLASCRSSDAE